MTTEITWLQTGIRRLSGAASAAERRGVARQWEAMPRSTEGIVRVGYAAW